MIGNFLVEKGYINEQQRDLVVKIQRRKPTRFGELCVQLGFLDEDNLRKALKEYKGEEDINIDNLFFDERFFVLESVRNDQIIRLISNDGKTSVLLTTEYDSTVEVLKRKYTTVEGKDSYVKLMSQSDLFSIFIDKAKAFFERQFYEKAEEFVKTDNPANFLEALLSYATIENASDIHFDIEGKYARIRIRTEGVLRPVFIIDEKHYRVLLNHIKQRAAVPANVSIQKPIDAAFSFKKGLINIDLRVSIIPSAKAQSLGVGSTVLRIFSKGSKLFSLENLGYHEKQIQLIREWFRSQSGMIIISGPTGSGKSTTVRAALTEVIDPSINVMSVEDPVESLINLMKQVEAQGELTFEEVLKAMLRHDPDIIFVGEIRNQEVAKISLHAALTGHLVIATLHATNSLAVIPRLLELGVDQQILLNTLKGVISQRLIRKICSHCKEKQKVDPLYEKWSKKTDIFEEYKGRGCEYCHGEGFKGRTAIAEVVPINELDASILLDISKQRDFEQIFKEKGLMTLLDHGVEKVKKGITTLEEVVRVL